MPKIYIAIDLKSFYASVECVDRGLDPLTENLVVADITRTEKTICLAVSPALKALGIPGRARLYEIMDKAQNINLTIAPPRMARYMEISTKIVSIYNRFVAPEDIHIYSIDEVFIDATSYLKTYQKTPEELAREMIKTVLNETGITATAGIGTNLYLAKIAMDIVAKHIPADENGVRIASLDEKTYREKLWTHEPLQDFWRIGKGLTKRLHNLGIRTMGDLAKYSITGSDKLYKEFGKNAELMIDHAWGHEPVEMRDIKNYRSNDHSFSNGQVLSRPYSFNEAEVIIKEMADQISFRLASTHLTTDQIALTIVYDISNNYEGEKTEDFYGRMLPKNSHASRNLSHRTASTSEIVKTACELYQDIANKDLLIRKIYIATNHIKYEDVKELTQLNIFTDYEEQERNDEKEKELQRAILKIQEKYGKNAIVKAMSLEEGATTIARNRTVGGHRA